ncbi:MAG TPA: hypothetical protein VFH56_11160 [Acidimicrobiales bacterium]|nr:hypothetical protein [Acidimicrobiales bacterium]
MALSDYTPPWAPILAEVDEERVRQNAKWGEQNHPDGTGPDWRWVAIFRQPFAQCAEIAKLQVDYDAKRGQSTYMGILAEEFFEALAEDDPANLRAELVQVAAVAVAWIEAIDRRDGAAC